MRNECRAFGSPFGYFVRRTPISFVNWLSGQSLGIATIVCEKVDPDGSWIDGKPLDDAEDAMLLLWRGAAGFVFGSIARLFVGFLELVDNSWETSLHETAKLRF